MVRRFFWFFLGLVAGVAVCNSIRNKMTAVAEQMTFENVASHLWEWTRQAVSGLISYSSGLLRGFVDSDQKSE